MHVTSRLSNYAAYHRTERETCRFLTCGDFYLAVKSVIETKQAYCYHFNARDAHDRLTVWRTAKKFMTKRTVHNVNKDRPISSVGRA